ncbi:hypothetical protein AVEN_111883-1 [Araneus ventricosus]|uniref:Uncharacterized protein n=1 Tax=Araneus ventricosus TaxID=182803 RepID=A0A4Y2BZ34_ARAVE|nr:hypothetical protein AVEN_111883-1 [Araneus ventricosus]
MIGSGEFQRTQIPKLHPPIPIWGFDASVAVKQRICLHWDLASRLEMKLKTFRVGKRSVGGKNSATLKQTFKFKTNFGISVNVLPNFSTKRSGIHTSCEDKWLSLSFT